MISHRTTETSFLDGHVSRREVVNIFLCSGTKLIGILESHDTEALFLRELTGRGGRVQMVYKTNVSTVCPIAVKPSIRKNEPHHLEGGISDLVDEYAMEESDRALI
jgi:sRNA-binding regulator protein Hfq